MLPKSDIEVVFGGGNTLDVVDNEGLMVSKKMYDTEFGGAGSDEYPFVAENVDTLLSVSLIVRESNVSFLLEIKRPSSFDLEVFNLLVKSCIDCK